MRNDTCKVAYIYILYDSHSTKAPSSYRIGMSSVPLLKGRTSWPWWLWLMALVGETWLDIDKGKKKLSRVNTEQSLSQKDSHSIMFVRLTGAVYTLFYALELPMLKQNQKTQTSANPWWSCTVLHIANAPLIKPFILTAEKEYMRTGDWSPCYLT